jgi:hypothetical protein
VILFSHHSGQRIMPNLNAEVVADWLTKRDPNNAAALLFPAAPMPEGAEPLLVQLGQALDAAQARDLQRLSRLLRDAPLRERLGVLLTHLDKPRCLRLLDWLGSPPMPEHNLVAAAYLADDPSGEGALLRRNVQMLYRDALLSRIFGRERISSLLAACQVAGQAEKAA